MRTCEIRKGLVRRSEQERKNAPGNGVSHVLIPKLNGRCSTDRDTAS